MYLIEEIHPVTRKIVHIVAAVESAAVGKAAYEAACIYYPNAHITLRRDSDILRERTGANGLDPDKSISN